VFISGWVPWINAKFVIIRKKVRSELHTILCEGYEQELLAKN